MIYYVMKKKHLDCKIIVQAQQQEVEKENIVFNSSFHLAFGIIFPFCYRNSSLD